MAAGGGSLPDSVYNRFFSLAEAASSGGPVHVVVVPTAQGTPAGVHKKSSEFVERLVESTAARQDRPEIIATVLHTRDRSVADSDAFVDVLRSAHGVFFCGGRQYRLAETYGETKTVDALRKVLSRGGVVAGSSAGASILSSKLVRGEPSRNNSILLARNEKHRRGFGFIQKCVIDQHTLKRNRHFDLALALDPGELGIGVDESTCVVVQGSSLEVIGDSYVQIVACNRCVTDADDDVKGARPPPFRSRSGAEGNFYFLAPGDRLELEPDGKGAHVDPAYWLPLARQSQLDGR
jgi:cyanophycinase